MDSRLHPSQQFMITTGCEIRNRLSQNKSTRIKIAIPRELELYNAGIA
jgi:hypothetical protein